jgi:ferredoxin
MIAPDVFDIDDDGKGTVLVTDVPAELVGDVHRAIGNCPERAISVA